MSVGVVNKSTGDRIQTAGDPLDKVGNLANLTTNVKTDAVEAINEVNDKLTNGEVDTTSVQDVRFVKVGRVVTMISEVWHQGFTIPDGFRPWAVTYIAARVSAGGGTNATIGYIRIGTDGVLTIPDNTDFVGSVSWATA